MKPEGKSSVMQNTWHMDCLSSDLVDIAIGCVISPFQLLSFCKAEALIMCHNFPVLTTSQNPSTNPTRQPLVLQHKPGLRNGPRTIKIPIRQAIRPHIHRALKHELPHRARLLLTLLHPPPPFGRLTQHPRIKLRRQMKNTKQVIATRHIVVRLQPLGNIRRL